MQMLFPFKRIFGNFVWTPEYSLRNHIRKVEADAP